MRYAQNGRTAGRARTAGMTLIELMVATMLLLPILTVVMQNFITCMHLNAASESVSKAIWQERTLLAAIEKTSFYSIYNTYNARSFPLVGLNGYINTTVVQTDVDLVAVHISANWKDRRGRANGEDVNFNGQLDPGEDKNGNGRLDSDVGISTFIYNGG